MRSWLQVSLVLVGSITLALFCPPIVTPHQTYPGTVHKDKSFMRFFLQLCLICFLICVHTGFDPGSLVEGRCWAAPSKLNWDHKEQQKEKLDSRHASFVRLQKLYCVRVAPRAHYSFSTPTFFLLHLCLGTQSIFTYWITLITHWPIKRSMLFKLDWLWASFTQ